MLLLLLAFSLLLVFSLLFIFSLLLLFNHRCLDKFLTNFRVHFLNLIQRDQFIYDDYKTINKSKQF